MQIAGNASDGVVPNRLCPDPPVCIVPELEGLKAAGCATGTVKRKKSRRQRGRVLSQKVKPGGRVATGTTVALVVGR